MFDLLNQRCRMRAMEGEEERKREWVKKTPDDKCVTEEERDRLGDGRVSER